MRKFVLIIFLGVFQSLQAQTQVNARAEVKEVTVFANGAELSNQVKVNLPKGNVKLVIQNVASNLDIKSVQLSGPSGITILSMSQGKGTSLDNEAIVPKILRDSLELIKNRKESLLNKQRASEGALRILNNEQLLGNSSKVEVADITKLVDYYQVKFVELNASIQSIKKSIASEDKLIAQLENRVKSYVGNGSSLVAQLATDKNISGDVYISYMTYEANWQAYYDLKAKSISSPVDISYKAKITQYTGVDWKNVKLTLSTGNPSQNGNAPILTPSYAQYFVPNNYLSSGIVGRAAGMQLKTQNKIQSVGNFSNDSVLEEASISNELARPTTTLLQNQLSATFNIEVPYDIASNGEAHSVTLKEFSQPTNFKYYAVPKLDKDAYLLAEISDFEKLNLLPGEANIIFENMFVGNSYINPSITSDTLNLTMGRDKSIVLKRDRIMDNKSVQNTGSTKKQTFIYEITVKNNKSSNIKMVLKDQFPISADKSIEIELIDNGGATVNKETGVLTWIIDVKPTETKKYRFTYTIKHPKDKSITYK